jgi:cytochrome c oxidase cbb3-type subunit 1
MVHRMTASDPNTRVEVSCRWPLLALFGGAAMWLVIGSVLALIASIKFHGPEFLADRAWLGYGRVHPAAQCALAYGFAVPSALGAMLWVLAQRAGVPLVRPGLVWFAAKLWHLGVLVGLWGILAGGATGFEGLEFPRYAAAILFVAFTLLALFACLTHAAGRRVIRPKPELHPAQTFALAALFWLVWIWSVANLLLLAFPVRGLMQAVVAWWFAGNFQVVWLALAGLAVATHLLPELCGRPLESRHLALFVFLTLIGFGAWTGIPSGAPLPAWLPAVSNVAALLTLAPTLGIAAMTWLTTRGSRAECRGGPLCFVKFGLWMGVLSGLLLALAALPPVSRVVEFTWFGSGQIQLRLYGFAAMILFGAAYHLLPRVVGMDWPWPRLARAHFWLAVSGVLLLALPLLGAGVVQGLKLADPNIAFMAATRSTLMFLRLSTVGDTLLLLGNVLFLGNVLGLTIRWGVGLVRAFWERAAAPALTTEVAR